MVNPPPTMKPVIDQIVLDGVRAQLTQRGWIVVSAPQDRMFYTVGLTAYRLPELVVTGELDHGLDTQLNGWAARCVSGELDLGPAIRVQDPALREHFFLTRGYDIPERGGLWIARALYDPLVACEIDITSCRCAPCKAGLYRQEVDS